MELHQLEAFVAVAEELHFRRAAERLHMAQPPLSRTIQNLERDLGTQLFERSTRSVRLTATGVVLLGPARKLLADAEAARRAVAVAGAGLNGRVRIGFAGPSSNMFVGRLGRLVREQHPGIELSLRSTTYANEALKALARDELDLALVRWATPPPGIESRVISSERYVVVVPPDHGLAGRTSVAMSELEAEDWVALPEDPGSSVRDAFVRAAEADGYTPRIVQTAPDSWTLLALVSEGVGATFSLDSAVQTLRSDWVSVIPHVMGTPVVHSHLVWRRGDDTPSLRAVLDVADRVVAPTLIAEDTDSRLAASQGGLPAGVKG